MIRYGAFLFYFLLSVVSLESVGCFLGRQKTSQNEIENMFKKYYNPSTVLPDSVFRYEVSGDSLIITFPENVYNKAWKFDIQHTYRPKRYIVEKNQIIIKDNRIASLADTTDFILYAIPDDHVAYFDSLMGDMSFVYLPDQHGYLKLDPILPLFSIEMNVRTEVKDSSLLKIFIDSMQRRINQRSEFWEVHPGKK